MTKKKLTVLLAAVLSTAAVAVAQSDAPRSVGSDFYRLDFKLKELEGGKVVTTRNYQMMARTDDNNMSSVRSGGRIPMKNDNGFQYYEIGVNIDVRHVTHFRDGLTLDIIAEVSGDVEIGDPQVRPVNPPVVRQAKWNSVVLIPIQKPTIIFSSDDPTAKRQLQFEVTASPVR